MASTDVAVRAAPANSEATPGLTVLRPLVRWDLEARITRQTVELPHRGHRMASHERGGYAT